MVPWKCGTRIELNVITRLEVLGLLNNERRNYLVDLCQNMVKRPSLSGEEGEVAALIQEVMANLGYDDIYVDRYGNVIGTIVFGQPGPTLLFEGHMDHVSPGDYSKWTVDPYGGIVSEGKIFGRGTTDMKGNLSAMIVAASYVKADLADELCGELMVAGSVHEECFEGVASQEIGLISRPDYVVIGEPSSLDVKKGQRGRAEVVVETYGKSAHSASPHKGTNAVRKMVRLLNDLDEVYVPPNHVVLGKGILELTDIISFPYPSASVVPDRCRVTFDRRLLVGETPSSVLCVFEKVIEDMSGKDGDFVPRADIAEGEGTCYTGETFRAKRFAPAWLLDEDSEYLKRALAALRKAGFSPRLSCYSFCTNGSYYAGKAGIPTIGFGGSDEELAHICDEYIEIAQLVYACQGYYAIAQGVLSSN